jgi:hypothetical protein
MREATERGEFDLPIRTWGGMSAKLDDGLERTSLLLEVISPPPQKSLVGMQEGCLFMTWYRNHTIMLGVEEGGLYESAHCCSRSQGEDGLPTYTQRI